MLINIHTHHTIDDGNLSIINRHEHFEACNPPHYYSIGLHPWHIYATDWQSGLSQLKLYSTNSHVVAIGECGLDRVCGTDFKLQEKVFREQIAWANIVAKPLIIHCVRAHRECVSILKEMKNQMPVVFHGFNNKLEIALMLIQEGYYLSFGNHLLYPQMESVFASLSMQNIFLETDTQNISIYDIYNQAARIKNSTVDQLYFQIKRNTEKVFNIKCPR